LEPGCHYITRYWIAPGAEARVLEWLDGRHTGEMAALPGFLSARRLRLAETDSMGWRAFCTIYALESEAALQAYFANPIRERFNAEAAAFAGVLRVERLWGAVEWRSHKE
jgi:antibiotic biosynthesis monooxygenase (ABM) superfamily enzyme